MSTNGKALKNHQIIALAWEITGGFSALFKSADFWLTVLIWGLCIGKWTTSSWASNPISVLPNLLGFTLGGFAIFLGFGSESFKEQIADPDEKQAPYMSVSAAFLMVVFVQVFSLLYALVGEALMVDTPGFLKCVEPIIKGYLNPIFWGIGYFFFLYSIVLSLRAAMRIFRLSRWYNAFIVSEQKNKASDSPQ